MCGGVPIDMCEVWAHVWCCTKPENNTKWPGVCNSTPKRYLSIICLLFFHIIWCWGIAFCFWVCLILWGGLDLTPRGFEPLTGYNTNKVELHHYHYTTGPNIGQCVTSSKVEACFNMVQQGSTRLSKVKRGTAGLSRVQHGCDMLQYSSNRSNTFPPGTVQDITSIPPYVNLCE